MDLIDKQSAIDALMKRDKELRNINWYDKPFAEGECKGIDYALEIVNALPSAQPTQPNTSNALKTLDCISRQAAIDAFDLRDDAFLLVAIIKSKIKNLPSAQPVLDEWCTDCKEYDQERHCCPRWNRVIRTALDDAIHLQKEQAYMQGYEDARKELFGDGSGKENR